LAPVQSPSTLQTPALEAPVNGTIPVQGSPETAAAASCAEKDAPKKIILRERNALAAARIRVIFRNNYLKNTRNSSR
jgi:hypothetical protein